MESEHLRDFPTEDDGPEGHPGDHQNNLPEAGETGGTRPSRMRHHWRSQLDDGQRSAVIAWTSFAVTFGVTRALTHWIRDGHGPAGGGISAGGKHFHHYNIGIAILTAIGAIAIRGEERHRRHPTTAVAFGAATALIADEAALLIDLEDVYWNKQGRTSVDLAVSIIGIGGIGIAGRSFWPTAARELGRPL